MRKSRNTKIALIIAVIGAILLSLFIPSKVGSTQVEATPLTVAQTEDEPAIHTPPVEDNRASLITKTIALLETSGTLDCSQTGLSGEKGCHQFMPSTWRAYSIEVYGHVATQTPAAAEHVTKTKVQKWLDEGLTPRQIFLIWNQGHPGQCKAGTNRHGVKFDSCAYANKAIAKLQEVTAKENDKSGT